MNRKQYLNRLNKVLTKVDKDITKAILLTHEFKDSHPEIKDLSSILNYTNEDRALDDIACQAVRIKDILAGKISFPCEDKSYARSLVRKVRKVLGYTI